MSNSNQNKPQKPNTHSKTPWDTFVGWVNGDEPEDKAEKPELFAVPEEEAHHHDEQVAYEINEEQNDNEQEVTFNRWQFRGLPGFFRHVPAAGQV